MSRGAGGAAQLDLMDWHARTLFRHDAAGRLTAINEGDEQPAPRLWVGRTTEGALWRFRHDLPSALTRELDELLTAEPPATDPRAPLRCEARLRALLAAHAPIANVWQGPIWYCPEGLVAGAVEAVRVNDGATLRAHFPHTANAIDALQPCCAVFADGVAVAVCRSARTSAMAAEAGVDTLSAFRGRGYAAATVAAWAAAVREMGRLPLYSTSWDNLASRGVARKLGLVSYGATLALY